jgi:hypothetical protein
LDCLGFTTPFCFFVVLADLFVVEDLRFGGGGSGAGFMTGEDRKADGDGIVIVSILTASYTATWTILETMMLNIIPWRWSYGCVV